MRGLFTSALVASTWATTLALHSPAGDGSHNVEMEESSSNAPTGAVVQRRPQQVELPDLGRPNLEDDENAILSQRCLEDEIAHLKYMRAQLRELRALIAEQELVIARQRPHIPILECDDLACVTKSLGNQVRHTATIVVDKCKGSKSSEKPLIPLTSGRLRNLPQNQPYQGEADHGDVDALTGDLQHENEGRPKSYPSLPKKLVDLAPVNQYTPPSQSRPSTTTHRLLQQHSLHIPSEDFTAEPRDDPAEDHTAHSGIPTSLFNEHQPAQRPTRLSVSRASEFRPPLLLPPPNPPRHMAKHVHARPPPSRGSQSGFSLMIVLSIFVLIALHRRWRHARTGATATLPKVERCRSRRAERFYRRAMRRAAQKKVISDVLARLGYQRCCPTGATGPGPVDDGASPCSTTMGDDISEFRNIADIVGDLIAAEEGRSRRGRARCAPACDSVPERAAVSEESNRRSQGTIVDLAMGEELSVYEVAEDESKRNESSSVVDGDRSSSAREQDAIQAGKESEDVSSKGTQ